MKPITHLTTNSELPIDSLYRGRALNPNAIAAIDDTEQVSYQELVDRTEALALALRQQLPDGSRVALCAQNHIAHLTAFLAILAGGFIWLPINPKNGQRLNDRLLEKTRPALVMIDRASRSALQLAGVQCLWLDRAANGSNKTAEGSDRADNTFAATASVWIAEFRDQPFRPSRPDPEAIMAIKFTGGSSGEPKGVMQSHRSVTAVIDNMQAMFEFRASDHNLAVAPLTHGGSHYILPLLRVGGRHLLLPQPDTGLILDAFSRRGASVCFMPPTLIYKLLQHEQLSPQSFPKLRHLTYSAAPMPAERITQVIKKIGPYLSTLYGQTEAPMSITAMSAQDMQNTALQRSVGRACKHSQLCVFDPLGQSLPAGTSGEIAVRGDLLMSGYFDDRGKTTEAFNDDWLLTGDLGYVDSDGYLFLQGRRSELIISGGFNVYPGEVEDALLQLPGIAEAVAFGRSDDYWGERVELAVCLDGSHAWSAEELRQSLKASLGPVKAPKVIHLTGQLPRNPVGKVVRREVQAMFSNPEPV